MDRKTLVAAVGAVALTLVAASSAMAVNLGILDSSSDSPLGGPRVQPAPTTTTAAPAVGGADDPEVIHLTVRDLPPTGTVVAGATGAPAKATPSPAAATAVPAPTSPRVRDDEDDDEDEHEDERHDTRRPRRGDDDDD